MYRRMSDSDEDTNNKSSNKKDNAMIDKTNICLNSKGYCLFIFRRDLRCYDNRGLIQAMKDYGNVIPIFIYTPEQVSTKNAYRSENAIEFMTESLYDLERELKKYGSDLHLFHGDNVSVLRKIMSTIKVCAIVWNEDYTPYAQKRDKAIESLCKSKKIDCVKAEDYLLSPIGTFLKSNDDPYTIFTPFRNNVLTLEKYIDKPTETSMFKTKLKKVRFSSNFTDLKKVPLFKNQEKLVSGGRKNGLSCLARLPKQRNYNKTRSDLSLPTSQLSAYIKFGCLSIREVYWRMRKLFPKSNDILSQLIWREFYFYIGYYYPKVLKGKNFQTKWKTFKWRKSEKEFKAWCEGRTGFPIIDAGMRELNTTGYMHNRARLITSNFLNRILGQDWRRGEKYFASQLTDYDPLVNNGNWQWIASTGTDTSPYSQRLFNPWLQGERYDPDCKYIKKWIPELKNVERIDIHHWDDCGMLEKYKEVDYPAPIVDYSERRQDSLKMYRDAL